MSSRAWRRLASSRRSRTRGALSESCISEHTPDIDNIAPEISCCLRPRSERRRPHGASADPRLGPRCPSWSACPRVPIAGKEIGCLVPAVIPGVVRVARHVRVLLTRTAGAVVARPLDNEAEKTCLPTRERNPGSAHGLYDLRMTPRHLSHRSGRWHSTQTLCPSTRGTARAHLKQTAGRCFTSDDVSPQA
jgi:hypothetical protein